MIDEINGNATETPRLPQSPAQIVVHIESLKNEWMQGRSPEWVIMEFVPTVAQLLSDLAHAVDKQRIILQ